VTAASWPWLGVAMVAALCDWWAVWTKVKRIEIVCKPLVVIALIAVAVAVDPVIPGRRAWVVAAFVAQTAFVLSLVR
jgi:hypothetical protein